MGEEPIKIYPIGIVKNDPENGLKEIQVYQEFTEGLNGVERWGYLWIMFWMSELPENSRGILRAYPMGDKTKGKRGVFALRSPMRPNPIGLTKVKLLSRDGNVLKVEDLDALDGTPVIDIKPVISSE